MDVQGQSVRPVEMMQKLVETPNFRTYCSMKTQLTAKQIFPFPFSHSLHLFCVCVVFLSLPFHHSYNLILGNSEF